MSSNENTATPVYRVLGTTDEVTECDHCGRTDLKSTIRLGVLDDAGNVDGEVYFGATCGARAAGWTVKSFRSAATAADRARKEAEYAAKLAAMNTESDRVSMLRWTSECPIGPSICRRSGKYCEAHSN